MPKHGSYFSFVTVYHQNIFKYGVLLRMGSGDDNADAGERKRVGYTITLASLKMH